MNPDDGQPASAEGCRWLYADSELLALYKPSGVLSVPGKGPDKQDCAWHWAQRAYPEACVVHRLDMATSGLLLLARSPAIQRALGAAFAARQVGKRYLAVVAPALPTADDAWHTIDLPIGFDWAQRPLRHVDPQGGKPSQTRYRALPTPAGSGMGRVELEPLTGRTHQLRVHLAAIGHPIVGDRLYAPPSVQALAPRLLLHAASLELLHPGTGAPLRLHCPPDF